MKKKNFFTTDKNRLNNVSANLCLFEAIELFHVFDSSISITLVLRTIGMSEKDYVIINNKYEDFNQILMVRRYKDKNTARYC